MENPGRLREKTETGTAKLTRTFPQGTDYLAAPLPCPCLIPCTPLGTDRELTLPYGLGLSFVVWLTQSKLTSAFL